MQTLRVEPSVFGGLVSYNKPSSEEQHKAGRDLYWAAKKGDTAAMSSLLAAGANVEWGHDTNNGKTPLHAASVSGDVAAISMLLTAGALVNALCHNGKSAVTRAAEEGHAEAVQVLLSAGADPACGVAAIEGARRYLESTERTLENKRKINSSAVVRYEATVERYRQVIELLAVSQVAEVDGGGNAAAAEGKKEEGEDDEEDGEDEEDEDEADEEGEGKVEEGEEEEEVNPEVKEAALRAVQERLQPPSEWSSNSCFNYGGFVCKSFLSERIANLPAGATVKHLAVGGEGNYVALCTLDDTLYCCSDKNKAKWRQLPAPPLRDATVAQLLIRSADFDFQQFDIMSGGVNPFELLVLGSDGRLLRLTMAADTKVSLSGWQEVSLGAQLRLEGNVPAHYARRELRATYACLGDSSANGGALIGFITTNGEPGVCYSKTFSNVNGGEPFESAVVLWSNPPCVKVACGTGLLVGIDADGSLWRCESSQWHPFSCDGFISENESVESGVQVVDVDVHCRDIVAVTEDGTIHMWTRDAKIKRKGGTPSEHEGFETAKKVSLPDGYRCVRAAAGAKELVVAISECGEVFTFAAGLRGAKSYRTDDCACFGLGRTLPSESEDQKAEFEAVTCPTIVERQCSNPAVAIWATGAASGWLAGFLVGHGKSAKVSQEKGEDKEKENAENSDLSIIDQRRRRVAAAALVTTSVATAVAAAAVRAHYA